MPFISKVFLLLLIAALAPVHLWASCGAMSCPIAQACNCKAASEAGTVLLDYSYQYINQDEVRVGTDKASAGQVRGHHDELYTVSRVQTLRATAVAHRRFSFSVALPMVQREHQHIHNHRGTPLLESWNISGLGDVELLTRTALLLPSIPSDSAEGGEGRIHRGPSLSLLLGGKFPTGKTNARGTAQITGNALQSSEAEIGIQPGSGAYDFLAGAAAEQHFPAPMLTRELGQASVLLEVLGRFTGKGKDDYRLGNSLVATAGVLYPATRKLDVSFQVNGRYARPDERGATGEETEKTGGVWVYASPGLQVRLAEQFSAYTHVQIPVYQNVNQIQLVSVYNLILGVAYKFNIL